MTAILGVGVIGANLDGSWGVWAHLPALRHLPGLAAVAVATTRQDSADRTAAAFGVPRAFGDPRALVERPEVDIVAVCVRVPHHRELVELALDAGKHVYCEWPLARDSAEAEALHRRAEASGRVHMVGLQARHSPVLNHAKAMIAAGAIGRVRAVGLTHSVSWIADPAPGMEYLNDRASGAHFLSIAAGHAVDAVRWMLCDFKDVKSIVRTTEPTLEARGGGRRIARTSADQIAIIATLHDGAVASLRFAGVTSVGTGVLLEINGDVGDLVIRSTPGAHGVQMGDLTLHRSVSPGVLEPVAIPEHRFTTPAAVRGNPPLNVGVAWLHMADAIRAGRPASPDFGDAATLHRLLDRIEGAADG